MNKAQFVKYVKEYAGYSSLAEAESAVNNVINAVTRALSEGKSIELVGFGKFYTAEQKERRVKTPSGEETIVPAKRVPKFKAGKTLKELIAKQ